MKTYYGSFYLPGYTQPHDATVLVFDKSVSIGYRDEHGSNMTVNWVLKDVDSQFEMGRQRTRIRSSRHSGMELFIDGNDADNYIKELFAERSKAWHKKSSGKEWIRNTLLLIGIAGAIYLLYLLLVPWISSKLANKVSVKTERSLGDAVYDAMGLAGNEDTAASFVVNEFFSAMDIPTAYAIRITVINDATVNAFALPGGRIVVYTGLLKELETYPELAALLSHEFTHVNNKHTTKSIFRRMGSKIFLGLVFGNFGTVANILVDHADALKSLHYSRRLEKEADMDGLAILTKREIDPAGFVNLFETLRTAGNSSSIPEFLASHPDTEKRISYIREASAGAAFKEDPRLKSIFEKLK